MAHPSIDLESINKQIAELEQQKIEIINARKAEKIKEARKIIAEFGLTAAELGFKKSGGAKKAEPMYQHPDNPELTWSGGRGRKPDWVKEWEKAGKDIEKCRTGKTA